MWHCSCVVCVGLIFLVGFPGTVQFSCSVVSDCDTMDCSTPGLPVHHQLPESVMPSNCLILCRLLLLPPSGSFQLSQFFISGGQSIEASASVLPMKGRTVQGTLKILLQHHSFKALILQCSAFFMVQLSHPYMTTGKTVALTWRTFVDKGMSLLFNMSLRLVIAFLPRSKCLLISWL